MQLDLHLDEPGGVFNLFWKAATKPVIEATTFDIHVPGPKSA